MGLDQPCGEKHPIAIIGIGEFKGFIPLLLYRMETKKVYFIFRFFKERFFMICDSLHLFGHKTAQI